MKCDKARFETKSDAISRVKEIKTTRGDHRKPNRVYFCPDCKGYHLTSKAKRGKLIPLEKYHPGWAKLL
jgi:uncharacterized protein YlaI